MFKLVPIAAIDFIKGSYIIGTNAVLGRFFTESRLTGTALVCVLISIVISSNLHAQVKDRWRLDFNNEKPDIFSHADNLDRITNYWYFTYEITNNTTEIVPLYVSVMLYIETGKELQDDPKKVDVNIVKEVSKDPDVEKRPYERLKLGRFFESIIRPEVEYKIIERLAGLGNRSEGIIRESIEKLKQGGRYLNPAEIRARRFLNPGETVQGLAVLKGIDPRANLIQIQVCGLYDVMKINQITEDSIDFEYENRVLKISYEFPGDPYDREKDVLIFKKKEWDVKKIGPISNKENLEQLLKVLVNRLKDEKKWQQSGLSQEEIQQERLKSGTSQLDLNVIAYVFQKAVEKDFDYDNTRDVLGNEKAIWSMHDWWILNKSKLYYDEQSNKFVTK